MNRALGIDAMTVFGMPPVSVVALAADLGCSHISTALAPVPWKLDCFPDWSLRKDARLRRDMMAAMSNRGISIALTDGWVIRPNVEVGSFAADLDVAAELGAPRASSVSMEPDMPRALDQFAQLAELASDRGMRLVIEFAPPHPVNSLEKVLSVVRHIGRSDVSLVIDAMHFFRTGASIADLATIDPGLIGYVQLCDAPLISKGGNYYQEACFERLCPGEGELPLVELMRQIPDGVPVGLEVPMRSRVETEDDVKRMVGLLVGASRAIFAAAEPGGEARA